MQRLALHVARALDAAHDHGILHRDLKPANIFRLNSGETKILDFGVAKMAAAEADDATELTAAGTLLGTVKYMSPEQVLGKSLDGRSDLFSLGAVLYEAATGSSPFAEASVGATLNAVVNDDTVTLSGSAVELSGEFVQIVDRLLAKDPSGRFASAAHLVEALERASSTGPVGTDTAGGTVSDDRPGAAEADASPSIAVLPFANFSADPDSDFFSDGLAEELTTGLSRVKGLRVAARSSAFRFKDRDVDAREAGRELGVSSVLEGSVRRAGDRVRITVQLVEVATGYQSWSERYDGTLEDIFQIQEDTATAIIEQLQVKLGASGPTNVLRHYTTKPEAYEMYLRGRFHWERRQRGEQTKAIECFRAAVAIDPEYPLAHVGIADAQWSILAYGAAPAEPLRQAAKRALDQALEIDPELPEAHASRAVLATMAGGWERAERLHRRAISLDPTYWLPHAYMGLQAGLFLRHGDVEGWVSKSVELEPESAYAWSLGGLAFYYTGDHERAVSYVQRSLELDDTGIAGHMIIGLAYSAAGEHADAVGHLEQCLGLTNRLPTMVAMLAYIVGVAGDLTRCRQLIEELERRAKNDYLIDIVLGLAYLGLGDREKAHRLYLKCIHEERPPAWIPCMASRPFPDILEMYGLPIPEGPSASHQTSTTGYLVPRKFWRADMSCYCCCADSPVSSNPSVLPLSTAGTPCSSHTGAGAPIR